MYRILILFLLASHSLLGQQFLAKSSAEQQYVAPIYEQLLASLHLPHPPSLKIWRQRASMAFYQADSNWIVLDQKMVQLCQRLPHGQDAMAFLLAHELSHHRREHGKRRTAFAAKSKNFQLWQQQETQADQEGAFWAYMAGFDPLAQTPSGQNCIAHFMEKAYADYQLAADLQGYLPLPLRQKAYEGVLQRTEELIQVFEAGQQWASLGGYLQAEACYHYLIDSMGVAHSQLLHNMALVQLQFTAQAYPEAQFFPNLLHNNWKRPERLRGAGIYLGKSPKQRLALALDYFRQVAQKEKMPLISYLGYAQALYLIHQAELFELEAQPLQRAEQLLKLAEGQAKQPLKAYIQLAEAIIWNAQGEPEKALLQLEKLAQTEAREIQQLAQLNQALIQKEALPEELLLLPQRRLFKSQQWPVQQWIQQWPLESVAKKQKNLNQQLGRPICLYQKGQWKLWLWMGKKGKENIWVLGLHQQRGSESRQTEFMLLRRLAKGLERPKDRPELQWQLLSEGLFLQLPQQRLYYELKSDKTLLYQGQYYP